MDSRMILCLFATILRFSSGIPIDNGVDGDPEIECGASAITTSFNTRNNFDGHVYVLGRYNEAGCRNDEGGQRVASIKLAFDKCGTQRQRSLNPKGIFVIATVVITFHPQFLTKVDRAYRVQCFYMEADKTVSQELQVSEITTAFQSQTVPMPVCSYQILESGPNGQPVKFASIGQQVYHKWNCQSETTDIFCAIVHSCFVDDGAGNRVQLLDQNGCALDRYLLQNLEYASDLMAGQEAHVFKYADKPALFFQCQISITIKEPNDQCPRPQCASPGGAGAGGVAIQPGLERQADPVPSPSARPPATNRTVTRPISIGSTASTNSSFARKRNFDFPFRFRRFKRDMQNEGASEDEIGVWDVQSQSITTLDVGEPKPSDAPLLSQFNDRSDDQSINILCVSRISFLALFGFALCSAVGTGFLIFVLWIRKCRSHRK